MSSPTQRTLAECKKLDWLACVVEKWIPQTRQRKDAFGFGDILAVSANLRGAILIQATSTSNMSARVKKIRTECWPAALAWLRSGNWIFVWGWSKKGPRGKRKLWTLTTVEVRE